MEVVLKSAQMYDTLVAVRRVASVERHKNNPLFVMSVALDMLNSNELLKEIGFQMEEFTATMLGTYVPHATQLLRTNGEMAASHEREHSRWPRG